MTLQDQVNEQTPVPATRYAEAAEVEAVAQVVKTMIQHVAKVRIMGVTIELPEELKQYAGL
ncbi:MAG TPA: hypothetical protein VGE06_09590 [Flavisolibacter sp.]